MDFFLSSSGSFFFGLIYTVRKRRFGNVGSHFPLVLHLFAQCKGRPHAASSLFLQQDTLQKRIKTSGCQGFSMRSPPAVPGQNSSHMRRHKTVQVRYHADSISPPAQKNPFSQSRHPKAGRFRKGGCRKFIYKKIKCRPLSLPTDTFITFRPKYQPLKTPSTTPLTRLAGEDGRAGNLVVGDRGPVDGELDSGIAALQMGRCVSIMSSRV
jgi:hypothetical protein